MAARHEKKGRLLTVKVPSRLLSTLDTYVAALRARDAEVTRTDAVHRLLRIALERETARNRLRFLRYMVVNAVRAVAPHGSDRARVADVQQQLADVPRDVLADTLRDLEEDGAVALSHEGAPGEEWVSLTPLVEKRWSTIQLDAPRRADAS